MKTEAIKYLVRMMLLLVTTLCIGCGSPDVVQKTVDVKLESPVFKDTLRITSRVLDLDTVVNFRDLFNPRTIERLSDSSYVPLKSKKSKGKWYPKTDILVIESQPDSVNGKIDIPVELPKEIPWYKRFWNFIKSTSVGFVAGALVIVLVIVYVRRKI